MSARERIAKGFLWAAQKALGYNSISSSGLTPFSPELLKFFGNPTASGKVVNEQTMLSVGAAWSCCRILGETIGSLPWAVYEQDASGNAKKIDHELSGVLVGSPNRHMTGVEFREALSMGLCQNGNAYSLKESLGTGRITSLMPLNPSTVTPERKPDGDIVYKINDRGRSEEFPQDKIWHVKGFGGNGMIGLSPLGYAREALGFSLATEEFGNKFFQQGGKPSGIVTIDKWLNKDQRDIARENLGQMLGGLANAHKFALFEGGMKPEAWGDVSLEDMLFVTVRKFSVAEIARFYRVPLHMVGDLDRATFSNIEHMSQEFVMFTLMPYFTRIESSVSKWLIPEKDRGKIFLRFNFEGLLRADSKGRAEFYTSALQNGWMNRNEVRAKENLNTVPGLDDYTVQANMALLDQLAKLGLAQLQPKPKPGVAPDGDEEEDSPPEKRSPLAAYEKSLADQRATRQ